MLGGGGREGRKLWEALLQTYWGRNASQSKGILTALGPGMVAKQSRHTQIRRVKHEDTYLHLEITSITVPLRGVPGLRRYVAGCRALPTCSTNRAAQDWETSPHWGSTRPAGS